MSFEFAVHPIRWDRCPLVAADLHACSWLMLQSHRGLAANTLDAYSRGLERYLGFLITHHVCSVVATRGDIGLYVASLPAGMSNATIQLQLTVVRLFHAYLMEEGVRPTNPAAQNSSGRAMVARHHKLPWIPNEEDWRSILASARQESIRNRTMLAFAYDAGLRREELCSLQSDDIDPSRRTLRIRAETTKGRRERVLPYSSSSGELLHQYLDHRRKLGRKRGPLFLSESRRNYGAPISIWSWSKIILQLARRAGIGGFTVQKECDDLLEITASFGELRQVISNLMLNSLDALGEGGRVTLRASTSQDPLNGSARIRITLADSGQGIDATVLPRIFEPFFTTKGSIGNGLGLWVCKQIIEKHSGNIKVRSRTSDGHGTTFSMVLPD